MQVLASNPLQATPVGNVAVVSFEVSVMDMERRGWHTQATGIIQLLKKEEDMMKEAKPFVIVRPPDYVYAQNVECEESCEGRLSRTVLWEGEGETPSLYSTYDSSVQPSFQKQVYKVHMTDFGTMCYSK